MGGLGNSICESVYLEQEGECPRYHHSCDDARTQLGLGVRRWNESLFHETVSLAGLQFVKSKGNHLITGQGSRSMTLYLGSEKHVIKVFSTSVMLAENYLISNNNKN